MYLLLDADGVLLKKQPYFSKKISEEYGVPYELMLPFYTGELKKCQVGQADMKVEIAKYLPMWNWTAGVEEYLTAWFTTDVIPDEEMLYMVEKVRAKGIPCFLASEQEKYRARHIWEVAKLKDRLDGAFFSCEVGALKSTPEYFNSILEQLSADPKAVTFYDDDQTNVDVAKSVGINARFYKGPDEFASYLGVIGVPIIYER